MQIEIVDANGPFELRILIKGSVRSCQMGKLLIFRSYNPRKSLETFERPLEEIAPPPHSPCNVDKCECGQRVSKVLEHWLMGAKIFLSPIFLLYNIIPNIAHIDRELCSQKSENMVSRVTIRGSSSNQFKLCKYVVFKQNSAILKMKQHDMKSEVKIALLNRRLFDLKHW